MNNLLIKLIQDGIELCERPFQKIANQCNLTEQEVIQEINSAKDKGIIKRFGAVVHHRKLGFKSNAMVVFKFSPENIDLYGEKISSYDFVRLCYQRPIIPNKWEYNLFCMVFAKDKDTIVRNVNELITELNLENIKHDILYTEKAYKQKGARYR